MGTGFVVLLLACAAAFIWLCSWVHEFLAQRKRDKREKTREEYKHKLSAVMSSAGWVYNGSASGWTKRTMDNSRQSCVSINSWEEGWVYWDINSNRTDGTDLEELEVLVCPSKRTIGFFL